MMGNNICSISKVLCIRQPWVIFFLRNNSNFTVENCVTLGICVMLLLPSGQGMQKLAMSYPVSWTSQYVSHYAAHTGKLFSMARLAAEEEDQGLKKNRKENLFESEEYSDVFKRSTPTSFTILLSAQC